MKADLTEVLDNLSTLDVDTSDEDPPLVALYDEVLGQLDQSLGTVTAAYTAVTGFAKRSDLFLRLEPDDLRDLRDWKRDEVLRAIFRTWVDAGRKLGFTTDSITSKRKGALVHFAQAVCACVTDPPTEVKAETIVATLLTKGKGIKPRSEWLSVLIDPET